MTYLAIRLFAAVAALALPATAQAAEGGLKMLTFAVLVYVMMKFVWPPLMRAIENRQKEIADGLSAGERGRQELADAERQKAEMLAAAKTKSAELVAEGEARRAAMIGAAQQEAEEERERIIASGRADVEAQRMAMQRELEAKLAGLVLEGASKIIQREADKKLHTSILQSLKEQMRQ